MYTTFNSFRLNELAFTAHYKTDSNNRFDLRLGGADLDLSQANGKDFPEEVYELAQKRSRQALQCLGSKWLDNLTLDFSSITRSKRPANAVIVFGNIEMRYKGSTIMPNYITKKEVGHGTEYSGAVFVVLTSNSEAGVYKAITLKNYPRNTTHQKMCDDMKKDGGTVAVALTTGEILPKDSAKRPAVVIDLDISDAEFDQVFSPDHTHGVDNAHLHTPAQQAAFEREQAKELEKARLKKQSDEHEELERRRKDEKPTDKEMGLRVGENFIYAKWDAAQGKAIARRYVIEKFMRREKLGYGEAKMKPGEQLPMSEIFYVSARLMHPTPEEAKLPPSMLSFQMGGPEYLIEQKDGSLYVNTLRKIYRSHKDEDKGKARYIFLGTTPLRGEADKESPIADGDATPRVKVKRPLVAV